MEGLDRLPEVPDAAAFVSMDELEVHVLCGASDDAHNNLFGLAPTRKLCCISRRRGINKQTSRAYRMHEDVDKVLRCEVRHESDLPLHVVIFGEQRQVPVAEQSAGGIV